MYHPTRGGVRGGRDLKLSLSLSLSVSLYSKFRWEEVKVDKHRENYLGHGIKAPVGRWQKGKDPYWYTRDKKAWDSEMEAAKEEVKRIKEQEEQAMREALGLAPKRASSLIIMSFLSLWNKGLLQRTWVQAMLKLLRAPRPWEATSSIEPTVEDVSAEEEKVVMPDQSPSNTREKESEDESSQKKRRREEWKKAKQERHEKRHSRDSDDKRQCRKDKEKRRHESDSD